MASSEASNGEISATGVDEATSFVGVLDRPPNMLGRLPVCHGKLPVQLNRSSDRCTQIVVANTEGSKQDE